MTTVPDIDLDDGSADPNVTRVSKIRERLEGSLHARLEGFRQHCAQQDSAREWTTRIAFAVILVAALYFIGQTWSKPRTIEDAFVAGGALVVIYLFAAVETDVARAANRLRQSLLGAPAFDECLSNQEMADWITSLPAITRKGERELDSLLRDPGYGFADVDWWIRKEARRIHTEDYELVWLREVQPMLDQLQAVKEIDA